MAVTSSSKGPGPTPPVYPPELRERAVRMVLVSFERGDQRFGTVTRIANQLGIGPEPLRKWVVQAEVDRGQRPGTSIEDARRIAELERENQQLRRKMPSLRPSGR